MADHTAEIAKLEAIVNGAVNEISVDGTRARYDLEQARKRLAELRTLQGDTMARPRVVRINLEQAW